MTEAPRVRKRPKGGKMKLSGIGAVAGVELPMPLANSGTGLPLPSWSRQSWRWRPTRSCGARVFSGWPCLIFYFQPCHTPRHTNPCKGGARRGVGVGPQIWSRHFILMETGGSPGLDELIDGRLMQTTVRASQQKPRRKIGTCRLCEKTRPLCKSHVVPEFLLKHTRDEDRKTNYICMKRRLPGAAQRKADLPKQAGVVKRRL